MIRVEAKLDAADGGLLVRRSLCERRPPWRWSAVLLASVWWCSTAAGFAHPAFLTAAEITVEADGSFHGRAEFDTLAFVLNDTSARIGNEPMEQLLSGPREELVRQLADARGRFLHGFQVATDAGPGAVDQLTFPEADEVTAWRDTRRPVLPVVIPVTMSGRLPPGARSIAVRFPSVLEQVILGMERPGEEPFMQPVDAGQESTSLPVRLVQFQGKSGIDRARAGSSAKVDNAGASQLERAVSWLTGTRFLLVLGVLVLLSFAGAFAWTRLTAVRRS